MKIGLITSTFNNDITDDMKQTVVKLCKQQNIEIVESVDVPGAYEIPFAASVLIAKKTVQGIVTLGAIIEGKTDHDKAIGYTIANQLSALSIEKNVPIALGVIGPGSTRDHAQAKAKDYATRAVESVVSLIKLQESSK